MKALAGVRRTSIEAGRYKAGWTRLSTGGRKRRAKALAAGTGMGSQGWGGSSGLAGDGNTWGPDAREADAPPSRFGEGGLSSRPQAIIAILDSIVPKVTPQACNNTMLTCLILDSIVFKVT